MAERFPNRTKAAVKMRWKRLASAQLRKAHALQVQGEHKAWDEEQEEQVEPWFGWHVADACWLTCVCSCAS